jgi:hypothetical protein
MKQIKIKIKGINKKLPLTFSNLTDCKAQLKCLLQLMPKSCKDEAKDKYRWNTFCRMVFRINEDILCDSLKSSMFPLYTFYSFKKKPPLDLSHIGKN